MQMEPGKNSGITECTDIDVAIEGHHGSPDVSQTVCDGVAASKLEDLLDHFVHPKLSVNGDPATADDDESVFPPLGGHPKTDIW